MADTGPILEFRNVSKIWTPTGTEALRDFSFTVKEGEICAIVGPSGCGKTTTLRILAGIYASDSGVALFRGQPVNRNNRECALMFQDPAVFQHYKVVQNVELALRFAGAPTSDRRSRALEMLRRVGLLEFANARIDQLSKGMQQRLAVAMALVRDPKALLMDEPFAALDVRTRLMMQRFLVEIWQATFKTIIIITHQIEEALLLADHIIMMSARPGSKKWETWIDVPRPREDAFFSGEFARLREHMLRLFYEEVTI